MVEDTGSGGDFDAGNLNENSLERRWGACLFDMLPSFAFSSSFHIVLGRVPVLFGERGLLVWSFWVNRAWVCFVCFARKMGWDAFG
jgi:hypothetical protein